MSVSYNRLWKLLIDHKMNRGELRVAAQMSPSYMLKRTRLYTTNYNQCLLFNMLIWNKVRSKEEMLWIFRLQITF